MLKKVSFLLLFVFITGCYTTQIDAPTTRIPDPNKFGCKGVEFDERIATGVEVEVVLIDGECYPTNQFASPTTPDVCGDTHYHYDIYKLDGEVGRVNDPSNPCGALTASEISDPGMVYLKRESVLKYNKSQQEVADDISRNYPLPGIDD